MRIPSTIIDKTHKSPLTVADKAHSDAEEVVQGYWRKLESAMAPDPKWPHDRTIVERTKSDWDKLVIVNPEQVENKYLFFLVQRCLLEWDVKIVTHVRDHSINNDSSPWMETIVWWDLALWSSTLVRAFIFACKPATVTAYGLNGVFYDDGSAIGIVPFFAIKDWEMRMLAIGGILWFDESKMSKLREGLSKIKGSLPGMKWKRLDMGKKMEETVEDKSVSVPNLEWKKSNNNLMPI